MADTQDWTSLRKRWLYDTIDFNEHTSLVAKIALISFYMVCFVLMAFWRNKIISHVFMIKSMIFTAKLLIDIAQHYKGEYECENQFDEKLMICYCLAQTKSPPCFLILWANYLKKTYENQ